MNAFHGRMALKSAYCQVIRDGYQTLAQIRQDLQGSIPIEDLVDQNRPLTVSEAIGNDHGAHTNILAEELQIPATAWAVMDELFMLLPEEDAMAWPGAFLSAIPVGADLSGFWRALSDVILYDPEIGVLRYVTQDSPLTKKLRALSAAGLPARSLVPHDEATIDAVSDCDRPTAEHVIQACLLADSVPGMAGVSLSHTVDVHTDHAHCLDDSVAEKIAIRYAAWVIDWMQRFADSDAPMYGTANFRSVAMPERASGTLS